MILPPERDNLEFGSHQIKISPKIAFFLIAGLDKSVNCSVVSDSLQPHELWPARLLCPWDFAGKNTGVGSHSLPGIFPTQGSNPCLLHCRQILFCLSHQGSPAGLDRSRVICWKLLTWKINPGESVPPWMMSFNTELIKHKCFAPGPHKQFVCRQPEGGKVSRANSCFCSAVATTRITGMCKGESTATGRKKGWRRMHLAQATPLVLNERSGEAQISDADHPCALTSSKVFFLSHSRWGTNILKWNHRRF